MSYWFLQLQLDSVKLQYLKHSLLFFAAMDRFFFFNLVILKLPEGHNTEKLFYVLGVIPLPPYNAMFQ